MGIADELQKLEQLRSTGVLTDGEFAQAKTHLLANPSAPTNSLVSPFIENQLSEVRRQNELARIDREWEIERRQFEIMNRHGRTFVPTIGTGVAIAAVGGIIGIFWTVIACTITNASMSMLPDGGTLGWIGVILPLIGIAITLTAVGRGVYRCLLAQQYNEAYSAYQERHERAETERGSV